MLEQLTPSPDVELNRHLRRLQQRFPLNSFENDILVFLENLQLEFEEPFLLQIETGNVPGMSPEDIAAFKRRVRFPF
jgi:hypothetical protein